MTTEQRIEQLIGYNSDLRIALEKGQVINDTDLYNIDILLHRLQDALKKRKKQ